MPWKECNVENERLRFVARLLDGEKMAPLCREFDISPKTGYKIFNRYKDIGLEGLTDRTRRPIRYANQLPFQVESRIVQLKKERPNWGVPKIRERLRRLHPDNNTPERSSYNQLQEIKDCQRIVEQSTGWSTPSGRMRFLVGTAVGLTIILHFAALIWFFAASRISDAAQRDTD